MSNNYMNRLLAVIVLFLCLTVSNALIAKMKNESNAIVSEEEINKEIPKVYFEGDISNMSTKADVRKIKLTYVSDDTTFESFTTIKIQGTSSLAYEKKNYTINLYENENYENKMGVDVGFGKYSKYCLKANWIDKTHARNIVTARIASEVQNKYGLFTDTPNNGLIDGFPIEVYINGNFLGLYTMNIPKSDWMFNMDENNPNHIVLSAEGSSNGNLFYELTNYNEWDVEVGSKNELTLNKFNRLVGFIKNSTDEIFKKNIDDYLNLDSAINYFIMLKFAELIDNVGKNMLMVTYDGNIWFPSLYDLDTAWGTNYDGLSIIDYSLFENSFTSNLWTRLSNNFSDEIKERYFELRKDILTKENVLNKFNEFANTISEEVWEKERARWGNAIPGYEISQIEEFLDFRIPLVDEYMNNLGINE